MSIQDSNQQLRDQGQASDESSFESYESSSQTRPTYHEMRDQPVQQVSDLAELELNLKTLSDLQSRLSFVMHEVRYLMKI
jgi:hypothetical protein